MTRIEQKHPPAVTVESGDRYSIVRIEQGRKNSDVIDKIVIEKSSIPALIEALKKEAGQDIATTPPDTAELEKLRSELKAANKRISDMTTDLHLARMRQ